MKPLAAKIPGIGAMALIAVWLSAFHPSSATANVVQGSGGAYGVNVNLNLTLLGGNVAASIGPNPSISNNSPPAFSGSASVAGLSAQSGSFGPLNASTVADLNTGLISLSSSSDVNGTLGTKISTSQSAISNLNLGLINLPPVLGVPVPDFLSISASSISSSATVSGDSGSLASSGLSTLRDLQIYMAGTPIFVLAGSITPGANTSVSLLSPTSGLSMVLNEQITNFAGNRPDAIFLTVNALRIQLNSVNVPGLGTLSGNITIGQSAASLQASPEPSSMIMLGLGLCAIAGPALLRRRRRRRAEMETEAAVAA